MKGKKIPPVLISKAKTGSFVYKTQVEKKREEKVEKAPGQRGGH